MNIKHVIDISKLNKLRDGRTNDISIIPKEEDKPDLKDEKLDTIIQMLNSMNSEKQVDNLEHMATLSGDDVNFIISNMLEIHEKYFKEFPLSENVDPLFIWNIQKPIIQLSKKLFDYGYSDMINPLFWLYMMCIDVDEYSFAKILKTILDIMEEQAYKEMSDIVDAHENREMMEVTNNGN